MARNTEKAMTALARWRAAFEGTGVEKERRPYLATECDDLQKCEKWRRQIIGEVSKKVAQIQNAGLGEFKLRDLNDEINKLLREKGHWEDRIHELGGPNYRRIGPRMLDHEGKEVPGNRGYKYFGAAKDLPGVKELFEHEPPPPPRKTRAELMKDIDADYYGYRDEDDGIIVPLEKEFEKNVVAKLIEEWKANKQSTATNQQQEDDNIYRSNTDTLSGEEMEEDDEDKNTVNTADGPKQFISHVPVPTQQEIEQALVQRKKMELLQKYTTDTLRAEADEAKRLLGI